MTNIELRKKEGESVGSFLYRFNKKMKQSGILKEVKKRRFKHRPLNKQKTRLAALYRKKKAGELAQLKKYGFAPNPKNK